MKQDIISIQIQQQHQILIMIIIVIKHVLMIILIMKEEILYAKNYRNLMLDLFYMISKSGFPNQHFLIALVNITYIVKRSLLII